ncbi:hypothetical protein AGMMS49545_18110 [Betaproteobacteria bacterium]|nr:hypothetical protein AGMMS49545_18110 [Betaproteobacteria bacterium]GHU45184.1 hypothetical protein AGMMS50289_15720 [Betaproteobacteria bacterium]
MLKNPENMATVNAIIEKIDRTYAEAAPLREKLATLEAHRSSMLKAAEAAEGRAEDSRAEMRLIMLETLGAPSKALLEKQAQHRSEIEMAEDYRILAQKVEEEGKEIHCQISPFIRQLNNERRRLELTFPRLLLKETLDSVHERLGIVYNHAEKEYRRSEFDPVHHGIPAHLNEKESIDCLFALWIKRDLRFGNDHVELPDYIRKAMQKEVRGIEVFSPVQIAMRNKAKTIDRAFRQRTERQASPL